MFMLFALSQVIYFGKAMEPFWNILTKAGIEAKVVYRIVSEASAYVDLSRVGPMDTMKVVRLIDGSIRILLKKPEVSYVILYRDGKVSVDVDEPFVERRLEIVSGEVEGNLYLSMLSLGEKPELVVKFADIFAWDIDFSVETENGDRFVILVEKIIRDGRHVGYGRIYYARYEGRRVGVKEAYLFGRSYYDRYGRSLQKMFLKSPLKVYRISSKFGRRFHPIKRRWLMHHGVDYAAPYGTPVFSVGSGWVKFAGWKGGYGKLIVIRHPKGYETRYAHLSRIAVRAGQSVEQGQYIGNVGSTGLSTGPHLHFEVRRYGQLVNPLKLNMQPKEPVPDSLMDRFLSIVEKVESFLERRLSYEEGR